MSKSVKIKLIVSLCVLALALGALILWACVYKPFDSSLKNIEVQLVFEDKQVNKNFTFRTNCASLGELIEKEKSSLQVNSQNGAYGKYIVGFLGQNVDSTKQYVAVLTNDEKYYDKANAYNVVFRAFDGTTCNSSTVGVDALPLIDGGTYVLLVVNF